MSLLTLTQISCQYDDHIVFENLNLELQQGEIGCLLGPSGCGKTTVLRTIAGFEPITTGNIRLQDRILSQPKYTMAPEQRHIGMVFQDYALFPHQTVLKNVCFGLRKLSQTDKLARAQDLLAIVGLSDYGHRYPHELSGGQQQRVALARALAPRPTMILLDEPFSNLDVDLRERLSLEVRDILKDQGITGLLVTHDQHEAFALGDKIGVMSAGHILQWDTAYRIYHQPAARFVADFIGQGAFLQGTLTASNKVETEIGIVQGVNHYDWPIGSPVEVLIRPDDIVPDTDCRLLATIEKRAFKGAETLYTLRLPSGTPVYSLLSSHHNHPVNTQIGIRLVADHLVAFPAAML